MKKIFLTSQMTGDLIAQLKEQREHIYNTEYLVKNNFKKAENLGELILTTAAPYPIIMALSPQCCKCRNKNNSSNALRRT